MGILSLLGSSPPLTHTHCWPLRAAFAVNHGDVADVSSTDAAFKEEIIWRVILEDEAVLQSIL